MGWVGKCLKKIVGPRPFDCIIFLSGVQVRDRELKNQHIARLQVGKIRRNEAGIVFGAATDLGNGLQPAAWPHAVSNRWF